MTTIPLRVCKAITNNKSQGIVVGPIKVWDRVASWLATGKQRKNLGYLVEFSRATDYNMIAISNTFHTIDMM